MWKFPEELSERAFGKLFREAKGALDDLQKDLTSVFSGMPSMSVDTYFDSGLGVDMCAMTDKEGCRRCRVGNGRPFMTVSIKADQDTKMGLITDLKQALREAYALKISYSARKQVDNK